jgi:hypothetical protein
VEPLDVYIDKLTADGGEKVAQKELYLAWGIFQITVSNKNVIRCLFWSLFE